MSWVTYSLANRSAALNGLVCSSNKRDLNIIFQDLSVDVIALKKKSDQNENKPCCRRELLRQPGGGRVE